ncbi:MAG TPA: hypothetical protein PLU17_05060 [Chitinophagaceae bacterium]|nr:hypothetical protein [Chitinophagaceae bacterium]
MKKSIIILAFLFVASITNSFAQQKTISKKEAKQIATDINAAIDQIDTSLDAIDWNALGKLLTQTIEVVDKNAEALIEIANNIDMKKVNAKIEKIAVHIEENVDVEKLEKQLNELGKKLEKSIENPEVK